MINWNFKYILGKYRLEGAYFKLIGITGRWGGLLKDIDIDEVLLLNLLLFFKKCNRGGSILAVAQGRKLDLLVVGGNMGVED